MEIAVDMLFVLAIFILGAVLRLLPHILFYFPATPDTFFFFNKALDPEYKIDEVHYPKLFTQLLWLVLKGRNKRSYRNVNRYAVCVDLVSALLLYVFTRAIIDGFVAAFALLLFLITPYVVNQGTTVSARSFGLLLISSSLLLVLLPFPLNWLAAVPMAMTLLTHRLSTQGLILISIALSVVDIQIPLIFLGSFALALILSKGEYLKILRNHVETVARYIRHDRYPNMRVLGLVLTPTAFGFMLYSILFILPSFGIYAIVVGDYTIQTLSTTNTYIISALIVWGTACLLLLVFWIAGESYKHLSLGAMPFAILTALLAENNEVFMFAALAIAACCLTETIYLQSRFEHIEIEFFQLLELAKNPEDNSLLLVPHGYDRAAELYSRSRVFPVYFKVWSRNEFEKRALSQKPDFALVKEDDREWFKEWKEIRASGNWVLFEKKRDRGASVEEGQDG